MYECDSMINIRGYNSHILKAFTCLKPFSAQCSATFQCANNMMCLNGICDYQSVLAHIDLEINLSDNIS